MTCRRRYCECCRVPDPSYFFSGGESGDSGRAEDNQANNKSSSAASFHQD
jgi:hypothetical protein